MYGIVENECRLGFAIKTVSNLLKREIDHSKSGKYIAHVTGTNGFIIGYLAEHNNEDIFQRDLEEKFSVRRSTMSNIICLMEEKGLLTRTPVRQDARLKKLSLTERGREIHNIMEELIGQTEDKLTHGFTEEEKELLSDFLERMKHNLEHP